MDGKTMLYQLRNLLQEGSTSTFLDTRTSYDLLYEAACTFVSDVKLLTTTQDITTVASTYQYNINGNFLCLYMKNDSNEYVVKYYDASNYYWPTYRDYPFVVQANNTTDQSVPDNFSIVDRSLISNVTGAATSNGTSSGGLCTLTDSAAPFSNVLSGDIVHNTTDGSDGVVTSVTSTSAVVTALFGGTNDYWTSADAYVVVPQFRRQLYIDPPSLTAGHTITLPYVPRPEPVYSDYGRYRIPDTYLPAVVKYAAWLYKYRDREPNFGDAWYKHWDMQLRKAKMNENRTPNRSSFTVNMRKRTFGDRSMR
jgi:hypothetical protein